MKLAGMCLVLLVSSCTAWSVDKPSAGTVARGEYLVTKVAMCGDCHSPMNEKGEPIQAQWLKGATLTFKPMMEMPMWATKAPGIAGMAGWSDAEALAFLTTGLDANGQAARPPMPKYRLSKEDAAAVLAYLRSLAPKRE